MTSAVVVHVEGFDDRHFLAGLIERLGWTPARDRRAQERVETLLAVSRTPGGAFGYLSRGRDRAVLVNPGNSGAGGDRGVFDRLGYELGEGLRDHDLVGCVDSDDAWDDDQPLRRRTDQLNQLDPAGRIELGVWYWRSGIDRPGVPRTQTLERLVLGVLSELETSKDRGAVVERFLAEEPRGPDPTGKHLAWATMAKWYGERGCGDFYQALWREDAFAEAMLATMDRHGILPALRAMLLA